LLRYRGTTTQWRGVIAFDDQTEADITRIWVYASAAEEGFTEDTNCADSVLALEGGAQAYNAQGGGGSPVGQWTINDIVSHASHIHTMGTHLHQVFDISTGSSSDKLYNASGVLTSIANADRYFTWAENYYSIIGTSGQNDPDFLRGISFDFYTSLVDPGDTLGPSTTLSHSTSATWRPKAALGIMVYPKKI
jgi:hypothetical protein